MARRSHSHSGSGLSRAETIAGWCYLPVYLFLLSFLLQSVFLLLDMEVSDFTLNMWYFGINLVMVLLIFNRFLRQRFFGPGFWHFLQTCVLGFVFYYAANFAVSAVLTLLGQDIHIYNNDSVNDLILENRYVMLFVTVIIAPVVEETLIRGLVFGSLRRTSRVLAYIVAVFLFSMMHVWQFFLTEDFWSVVLNLIVFIPPSVTLCWTYDRAGTIWAPITVHALINAISYGVLSFT